MHILAAAKFGYEAPSARKFITADSDVTGDLAVALASMPVRTDAPLVDNSAWQAAMSPTGANHEQ